MNSNVNLLDCIQFSENNFPCKFDDFSEDFFRFNPLRKCIKIDTPRDFLAIESSRECSGAYSLQEIYRYDSTLAESVKSDEISETTKHIMERTNKLLKPSKKISKEPKYTEEKKTTRKRRKNKKENNEKHIARQNAKKLSGFFKKWRDLRRKDQNLADRIKLWFSSYNLKLNKTYIYRDFFDSVRVHFRVALRDEDFSFHHMKQNDWQDLFVNLTEFLMKEVEKSKESILKGKKCQVYPVWIENLNLFTVGDLSTHLEEKIEIDSH